MKNGKLLPRSIRVKLRYLHSLYMWFRGELIGLDDEEVKEATDAFIKWKFDTRPKNDS